MQEVERKMKGNDLKKLQYNSTSSLKMSIILMVVGFSLLYYLWDRDIIFVKVLCGIIGFLGVLGFWQDFFSQKKEKDQREKIKIIVKTKIIDKEIIVIRSSGDSNVTDETKYRLFFENSKSYDVKDYIFNKMQIGSEIEIEYAKHSKWIINIYGKSMNIENDSVVQRY
ncbi:hypothetical protein [Maribacter sp. Asnod2-G09]|uniref:hypothetical protein n=1 Tax=Maribacter sp. Asnod2-G09 TaxID=3160577 RepID=UPI00386B5F9B